MLGVRGKSCEMAPVAEWRNTLITATHSTEANQATSVGMSEVELASTADTKQSLVSATDAMFKSLRDGSVSIDEMHTAYTTNSYNPQYKYTLGNGEHFDDLDFTNLHEVEEITKIVTALQEKTSEILDPLRFDGKLSKNSKKYAALDKANIKPKTPKDQEVTIYEYKSGDSTASNDGASFSIVAKGGVIYRKENTNENSVKFTELLSFHQFVRASCRDGADFQRLDLQGIDLSNKKLNGIIFIESDLSDANLSGTELYCTKLNYANAQGANFSGAKRVSVATGMHNTNLCGANMSGINPKIYEIQTKKMDETTIRDTKEMHKPAKVHQTQVTSVFDDIYNYFTK